MNDAIAINKMITTIITAITTICTINTMVAMNAMLAATMMTRIAGAIVIATTNCKYDHCDQDCKRISTNQEMASRRSIMP